jgi:hypothetical protein
MAHSAPSTNLMLLISRQFVYVMITGMRPIGHNSEPSTFPKTTKEH